MKTKEKILLSAKNYLLKSGEAGFTVRSIAAEAEVNQGLIHHYFGSKENLILELIDYVFAAPFEEVKRQTSKEKNKEIKDVVLDVVLHNKELMKLIIKFINFAQYSELVRNKMKNIIAERRDYVTSLVGIEDRDTKILVTSSVLGIILLSQIDDAIDIERGFKYLFNQFDKLQ